MVQVDRKILSQFLGEEKFNRLSEKFLEKENSIIVFVKPVLNDITIKGEITEVINPFTSNKTVRIINTLTIEKSIKDDWRRGSILFLQKFIIISGGSGHGTGSVYQSVRLVQIAKGAFKK